MYRFILLICISDNYRVSLYATNHISITFSYMQIYIYIYIYIVFSCIIISCHITSHLIYTSSSYQQRIHPFYIYPTNSPVPVGPGDLPAQHGRSVPDPRCPRENHRQQPWLGCMTPGLRWLVWLLDVLDHFDEDIFYWAWG